jgi:hypothetical protein
LRKPSDHRRNIRRWRERSDLLFDFTLAFVPRRGEHRAMILFG